MTFGTLEVLRFDEERHKVDLEKRRTGIISKVRRYYICRCKKCGNIVSIRGENLVSGNTKGCGCDMYKKSAMTRHKNSLNKYEYLDKDKCWIGYANNTHSVFLIDDEDFERVSKYCWYETNCGYIMTRVSKTEQIFLHRFILFGLDAKDVNEIVDHIDRNRLNCRKDNLRVCDAKGNARNKSVSCGTISGVLGVGWQRDTKKWRAYISENGKFKSLGNYKRKEDAVRARKEAEKRIYGEFAPK